MPTLYVVATPIGNLQDISLRALEVFKSVDFIICEDTRVTRKLLDKFAIKAKLVSHHQQSSLMETKKILGLFGDNTKAALVTDAGTPGVQDPGNKLISQLMASELGSSGQLKIIPIPGPSSVTALVSVTGLPSDSFLYLGYFPKKKGTQKALAEIRESRRLVIFFETGPRIIKTLSLLNENTKDKKLVVGRELTKQFESIYRGSATEVMDQLNKTSVKGEFVIAVY